VNIVSSDKYESQWVEAIAKFKAMGGDFIIPETIRPLNDGHKAVIAEKEAQGYTVVTDVPQEKFDVFMDSLPCQCRWSSHELAKCTPGLESLLTLKPQHFNKSKGAKNAG
jgi:hypothetical protein